MPLVTLSIVAVIVLVVASVAVSHLIAMRAQQVADVNAWFSNQMRIHPPQQLALEYIAVICSIMDGDSDLWWQLGRGHDIVDHESYHQQAIEFGRYLCVFGPLGLYESCYCPALYYGVFEGSCRPLFLAWIEFRYQDETVWVLTEEVNAPKIVRFSDFRVNHPGLTLRHSVYFIHDGLDANVERNLDSGCQIIDLPRE